MAQDILTTNLEEFRNSAWKLSDSTLKQLWKGLNEVKADKGDQWSDEILQDILRKENIIEFELQRRGYLNRENVKDAHTHMIKKAYKKKVF